MVLNNPYTAKFYSNQKSGSLSSAEKIIPFLLQLFHPSSVIDVGCGIGTWGRVLLNNHIKKYLGLDGAYIRKYDLVIPPELFIAHDLEKPISRFGRYDMALCAEVAEHLSPARSSSFITDLCRLSNVVVFSAAIPYQGGTKHTNEHWQSYWVNLFAKKHYSCLDIIRPRYWSDTSVDFWYRQNLFVFVKQNNLRKYSQARKLSSKNQIPADLVHPELFTSLRRPVKAIKFFLHTPVYDK